MKKVLIFFMTLAVLLSNTCFAMELSATSAVILEAQTGEILFEKNADKRMGMASTTKIMTALVALEKGKAEDIVKISPHAANVEGSSMYLKEGEEITLENLVYGLMLQSGNDAATAIAEHISGSEKKFAKLMNKKAKEVGISNTNFTNPHGLSEDNHYTTATDLARITAYALKDKTFSEIVSTKSKTIERQEMGKTTLVNHNKLLRSEKDCIGVKTGFTKATGRCLVTAWEKDNMKIICVTLNAGDDWNDHRKMKNFAYENYKATLYGRGGTVAKKVSVKEGRNRSVSVLYEDDIYLLEEKGGEWEITFDIPDSISAPIEKGEVVGQIVAENQSGKKIFFDAVAEKDVLSTRRNADGKFNENLVKIYGKWLRILTFSDCKQNFAKKLTIL